MSPERALQLSRAATSRIVARSEPDWEDMVQEGALRILKAAAERPDMPESWLAGAARNRARSAVQHRTWTGMEVSSGTAVDPLRKPHASIDEMVEREQFQERGYLEPGYAEVEDHVALREEISAAIERLESPDQRRVAVGRMEGRTSREVLADRPPKAANNVWWRAKTRLAADLAHLADAA